jgi:hypothetical protein
MNVDLPDDLRAFLSAGSQLQYNENESTIGRIVLKTEAELSRDTIAGYPGCQSIIDDPYEDLDGLYQIEVYDLVAESEMYQTEGLFCWIIALQCFGVVDPEHGDVLTFPGVTWANIVKSPTTYLDAQWDVGLGRHVLPWLRFLRNVGVGPRVLSWLHFPWDAGVGQRVLPWLHFPYEIREHETTLQPYESRCPVHDAPVTAQRLKKPPLFEVLRRLEARKWLQDRLTYFPYSGLPVSDKKLLCCQACHAAEELWLNEVDAAIAPLEAKPNAHGWIKCPGCGGRFMTTDSGNFSNGMHLGCGQKIRVVA